MRFAHEVELVPGVYFTETLISEEELAARLLGQVAWTLASGEQVQQNYLTVQQVFRETYEETVPYPTQEVENSDLAWGKRVPLQEGIDGTKLVTADVVYQDGQEQGRTIVSEETLVEAVPEGQLSLYAEDRRREKWERIDAAVDRLRQRYGYLSIRRARLDVHPELGRLNVRDDHVVHPVGYFGR